MKRIVCIGGGNGTSHVLEGFKQHIDTLSLSAVIAMTDSGGASGKLRDEFGVLPPGDILRAVIAMSAHDSALLKHVLYDTRYSEHGKLQGFGVGHVFIALAEKYGGGVVDAIRMLAQAVDAVGPVFPASAQFSHLCAELSNGDVIFGEHHIDRPLERLPITRCFLKPSILAYSRACDYIREADVVVLGPGSLHTSIIAALLPSGIQEAIAKSLAKIVFVSNNGYELHGEWCPSTLSQTVSVVEKYLPRKVDVVVSNSAVLPAAQHSIYIQKQWGKIEADIENILDYQVVSEPFEIESGGMDAYRIGAILNNVIQTL